MKKIFLSIVGIILWLASFFQKGSADFVSPLGSIESSQVRSTALLKYSFPNLSQKEYPGSEIKLEKILEKKETFTSYLFSFKPEGKKVTGMANLPFGSPQGKLPVVVMLRGYVDYQIYQTGTGTKKPAEFFAQNGFITLAPDFLGYGGSDDEDKDILVNRFERPITVLNLLSSIKNLPQADEKNVFLWGHSNGGQISISVLEILGKPIPTALWAPVTRGFPESVLNYSAQLDDQGKIVAERISEFEKDYDSKQFSISEYFEKITGPVQVHLGGRDVYIKKEWIEEFVAKMKTFGKEATFYYYPKSDHQLKQDWDLVVQRDLEFFRKNLK